MNKYIAVVDVETTGLSKQSDRIIQLSAIKWNPTEKKILGQWNHYIKPSGKWTISAGAAGITGLTDGFIEEHGESLGDLIPDFIQFIHDCDILTYNGNSFDITFLASDFSREGFEFPMAGRVFYDSMLMEFKLCPRNLAAVFNKYTGKSMEDAGLDAHDSLSDVKATLAVFIKQTENIPLEELCTWPENQLVSPEGSIRNISAPGHKPVYVMAVGKYKDQEIFELAKKDVGYLTWARNNLFSQYTLKVLSGYFREKFNEG